jgi:hypothetical protein
MNLTGSASPQARTNNVPLKLGIIGCGGVTETRHLPALQPIRIVEVVALSDISTERLNRVANLFPVKDRYTQCQQLLDNRSFDAVAVCVPAQFLLALQLLDLLVYRVRHSLQKSAPLDSLNPPLSVHE